MLNVALLGGASFWVQGKAVRAELGLAGRLLASYLFEFADRMHRRERLAELFWTDLEPAKARSALNTAIWRIRKMLELSAQGGGQHLITVGEDVMLESASFIQVDTRTLDAASKQAQAKVRYGDLSQEDDDHITEAIGKYAGPFLDGYDGDWILLERERLHCVFVTTTLVLMRSAARNGQYDRALGYARTILAAEPLRESVQRDLLVLLVLNGQRAHAVQAYHNLVKALKADLGIVPMPDTQQLYREIMSGDIFHQIDRLASRQFQRDRRADSRD